MAITAPASYRLYQWARKFIEGPALCLWEGDSITSTSTPRPQLAAAKIWRPALLGGWFNNGSDQITDTFLNAGNASRTVTATDVATDGRWYTGSTTVCPHNINRMVWTADEADGNGIYRANLNLKAFGYMRAGDWSSNVALKAKVTWWSDSTTLATATFRGRRGDDSVINTNAGIVLTNATPQFASYTVDVPAAVNAGANVPSMDIIMTSGVNEFSPTVRHWYPVCCEFYRPDGLGTRMSFLGSIGGATAAKHTDQTLCSDAQRSLYYAAIGVPDLFVINLGTNLAIGTEDTNITTTGAWYTNLQAMISNRRSICAALGKSPLFLLISPHDTNKGTSVHEAMSNVMYALAQANPDVSFIDGYQLLPKFSALAAGGYLNADNIHPTESGSDLMAAAWWAPIRAAYATGAPLAAGRVGRITR